MKLGAFTISLNVKDINVSKEFYENLGFKVFAGEIEKNYLIMKNENSLIGLFQGMFENNILTFNLVLGHGLPPLGVVPGVFVVLVAMFFLQNIKEV